MMIKRNIKRLFQKKKFYHCRKMDFQRAEKFFQENKENIKDMYLTLENNAAGDSVPLCIVKNGSLLINPICCTNIDNISETMFAVPCIHVIFNSGLESTLCCYESWQYDFKHHITKRPANFGIPYNHRVFAPYNRIRFSECFEAYDDYCKYFGI